MTFISYSQNLEDVMLWRALKHIEKGFYVDVGANDPVELSVTNAFYQAGWHGINIDPITCESLQRERIRDVNLRIAISSEARELAFYKVDYSALSTSDEKIAEDYLAAGRDVVELTVPALPLGDVLSKHSEGPIHFMNIDVEGAELDVLSSFDLSIWRPWILLVESTFPNTQIPTHHTWEPIVVSSGYDFVYFDGLNRFYIASEHSELREAFLFPPGGFDFYITAKQQKIEKSLALAEMEIQEKDNLIAEKEKTVQLYRTSSAHWLLNGPFGWLRKLTPIVELIVKLRSFFFRKR